MNYDDLDDDNDGIPDAEDPDDDNDGIMDEGKTRGSYYYTKEFRI